MISGTVSSDGREATIELVVQGPAGEHTVRVVVDTGFNGALTLPTGTVQELALVRRSTERGTLADGSEALLAVHLATVIWDGLPRRVRALATSRTPLVGMALLNGYELSMQVVGGGTVRISALGTG